VPVLARASSGKAVPACPSGPGLSSAGRTPTVAPTTPPSSTSRDDCWATGSSPLTVLATGSCLAGHGNPDTVGVGGAASYGAGLTRYLLDQHVAVVEVDRPDRRTRRQRGKSDPIDAQGPPPARCWPVRPPHRPSAATASWKAIRALRAVRSGATRGPDRGHQPAQRATRQRPRPAARGPEPALGGRVGCDLRPAAPDEAALADPVQASKAALRAVACRSHQLDEELGLADQRLAKLVGRAAPRLLAARDRGRSCRAAELLVTAGQRPERLRGEAAFAHLCGTAPVPASSGKTHRHRLHRGGDRDANRALHRWCPRTRA
jgi:transposase